MFFLFFCVCVSDCPQEHKDCEYYAKNMPYAFFYDPKFREFCPTSTQKYGLHFGKY